MAQTSFPCSGLAVKCVKVEELETQEEGRTRKPMFDYHGIDQVLLEEMVYDALVWSSLHGLLVGDKSVQLFILNKHAYKHVDHFSHNWEFDKLSPVLGFSAASISYFQKRTCPQMLSTGFSNQSALSVFKTKKADAFSSRLLDLHSKMLEINKKEEICLGLHRSDYMLDEQTKLLLQIELNTISSSFPGLSCLVTELHRSLLNHYGEVLGLDPKRIPGNTALSYFVEAFVTAWTEYNKPRALVMFVVQTEEQNMYDQHWLSAVLKERHNITAIRKTMAEIDAEAELLPDGTLLVGGKAIAVIYFRAGSTPNDYPSESEWRARLLMEQSSAIKCPSISYHLAGTKKIQQELAKPDVLERFLDNTEDIVKLRKCFAGLWSLDDPDIVKNAIERPELFVMKPQREGGGNNIYGADVRETLLGLQKEGTDRSAAYILMQRIFPTVFPTFLMRDGICHNDYGISELGIYGAYLRYMCLAVILWKTANLP